MKSKVAKALLPAVVSALSLLLWFFISWDWTVRRMNYLAVPYGEIFSMLFFAFTIAVEFCLAKKNVCVMMFAMVVGSIAVGTVSYLLSCAFFFTGKTPIGAILVISTYFPLFVLNSWVAGVLAAMFMTALKVGQAAVRKGAGK